jgi:hypothetical protein
MTWMISANADAFTRHAVLVEGHVSVHEHRQQPGACGNCPTTASTDKQNA